MKSIVRYKIKGMAVLFSVALLVLLSGNDAFAGYKVKFEKNKITEIPTKYAKENAEIVASLDKGRGLLDNRVLAVAADDNGNVAFATLGGVSVYNNGIWNNYTNFEGSADFRVTSLCFAADDNLYMATIDGMVRVDLKAKKAINLYNKPVYSVYCDVRGNVFMNTEYGVARYSDSKVWTYFDEKNTDMTFGKVYSVWGDGDLMMVGADRIVGFNRTGDETIFMPIDLLPRLFKSINKDKDGRFWFGSYNGLMMMKGEQWFEYGVVDGMSSENINQIIIDKDGNPWMATDNGIIKFVNDKFESYGVDKGLLSEKITGIAFDKNNNLWYSSFRGVGVLKGDKFENLSTASLFSDINEVSWAYPYISKLESLGIVKGYADGNFHPNYNVTRGEVLKMTLNGAGLTPPDPRQEDFNFFDLNRFDDWVAPYAQWAKDNKIFDFSKDPNMFKAADRSTRLEALKAILYAFNVPFDYSGDQKFIDVKNEDNMFVNAAINNGIIRGYEDGTFRPDNLITRAEMTKIISNAIDKFGRIEKSNVVKFEEDPGQARLPGSKTKVLEFQKILSKYNK